MPDQLPTPAEDCGRSAARIGFGGWLLAFLAGGLFLTDRLVADPNLTAVLTTFGQIFVGLGVVAGIGGVLTAALGYTRLMNGVPDPGLKWVLIGFAVSAVPLVGVLLYAVVPLALKRAGVG